MKKSLKLKERLLVLVKAADGTNRLIYQIYSN